MSLEENLNWLKENTLHLCHRFTVDDLGCLKRGGRLSATSAFLGTMIGIKPVLHVDNEGRLIPTDKVRGGTKENLEYDNQHLESNYQGILNLLR